MTDLVPTTLYWVPEFVRDLRVRWAPEEAGLPYDVATTPARARRRRASAASTLRPGAAATDGDPRVFETGAILLHLGERGTALMPTDRSGRAGVMRWVFGAADRGREGAGRASRFRRPLALPRR